jgi:5-methylthioribose kinase
MTNDELLATFTTAFEELHAKIDALPDGGVKVRAQRLAAIFHQEGNALAAHALHAGEITTFDGTSKPPPGP